MELDTHLHVFDQDFDVHSGILKLHSAFFFKFLDSPEQVPIRQTGISSMIGLPSQTRVIFHLIGFWSDLKKE